MFLFLCYLTLSSVIRKSHKYFIARVSFPVLKFSEHCAYMRSANLRRSTSVALLSDVAVRTVMLACIVVNAFQLSLVNV